MALHVSLKWLQDHLDLADKKTNELADLLTFAGVEVEAIHSTGVGIENVVVAQINESVQHPDAEKLSVCQVDDGTGTPRQIVCGAKNYKVGDKVPLALPGAVLPGDFKIKSGKLRGVVSDGMMCSGKELGLTDDHAGLYILPASLPAGKPISEVFESDTVFEVEITPNRPDLLSHLGMARELAALSKLPLKQRSDWKTTTVKETPASTEQVRLDCPERCPYYTARRVRGVKVAPSPEWLKAKLEALGLRPINNIVDITNYVLLEMGQPLHAFDADKLDGGIRVRLAAEGEKLVALNGEEYSLMGEDLVIADQSKALAIAGVMGGQETSVTETTVNILLESAYFEPSGIRRSSRRLDLSSDSSYRFERGIDPHQTAGASELAIQLILELAGGTADEVLLVAGEPPAAPAPVALDSTRAKRLLGIDLADSVIDEILSGLGLSKTATGAWSIPSYRLDLTRHIDLVEEIARVYGIENVPARALAVVSDQTKEDKRYDGLMRLREQLVALGYYECQTIKLIADHQVVDDCCQLRLGGLNEAVRLKNPLSQDHTTLRTSVVPGLLDVTARNIRQGAHSLKFFETGTVFSKHQKSPKALESQHLGILLAGTMEEASWHAKQPRFADFYDLVGLLENLFSRDGEALTLKPAKSETLLLAADILLGKTVIGRIGQLPPKRCRDMDWNQTAYVAEMDLAKVLKVSDGEAPVQDLPRFPAITRDVAMEVPADLPNSEVASFFAKANQILLVGAELFDVFVDPTGEKLPVDRKSLAYSLTYRSAERTLKSEEVDAAHQKVLNALQKQLGVKFR